MIGLDNCLRRTVCNKNVGTRNAAHSVSATKLFIYWLFGLMFLHSRTRSKDTEKNRTTRAIDFIHSMVNGVAVFSSGKSITMPRAPHTVFALLARRFRCYTFYTILIT